MKVLINNIEETREKFINELKTAATEEQLEKVRVTFLGRHGTLADLMKQLKTLPTEEKRTVGPLQQKLKTELEDLFNKKKQAISKSAQDLENLKTKNFDVTAYKPCKTPPGGLHPYTQITELVENIFMSMGYEIVDGPELEHDYYNFEALNIPSDHPARDHQDTFWLKLTPWLMRTHTSTVQIRAMEGRTPPIAVSTTGRAYRPEATDASHETVFLQTEALFIDKNVSLANLIATTKAVIGGLFGKKNMPIRVRPGYFPFVEPGIEVDMACPFCKHGCSVCKKTGWVELIGAGLVHPNVLRYGKIDPEKYSGFAIGFGLTRLAMLLYGIDDIRHFYSGNLQCLRQF